jgi:hypothetical protein
MGLFCFRDRSYFLLEKHYRIRFSLISQIDADRDFFSAKICAICTASHLIAFFCGTFSDQNPQNKKAPQCGAFLIKKK